MPDAPQLRLDDQLCFALYAASNSVVRAYRPLLAALGLSYPQYLVLMVLWETDGVPVKEIARRLDLPPHGVSPVLARLVRAGLVRRSVDAGDARVVRVHLTAEGTRMEWKAAAAQERVACDIGLSAEAYDGLRDQLRDLVHIADPGPAKAGRRRTRVTTGRRARRAAATPDRGRGPG